MLLQSPRLNTRGSILLVSIFVLIMLSMFVITVGYAVRQKLQVITRLDVRQKLRSLGDAAAQKAVYVLLRHRRDSREGFDALNQSWSQNEPGFKEIKTKDGVFSIAYPVDASNAKSKSADNELHYGLCDEERKININKIMKPLPLVVLKRLFKEVGMSPEDADNLTEAIKNWQIEQASKFSGGNNYYGSLHPPYTERHAEFATLQELLWVKGMTAEIYKRILPYITIESTGQVNLNTASRSVLVAVGLSPSVCDKIIAFRNGRDKIEGTADDLSFDDLIGAPLVVLANGIRLDDNEQQNLKDMAESGLLTVKSKNFSAYVLAQLPYHRQALRLKTVFDDKGMFKRWEEEFVVLPS